MKRFSFIGSARSASKKARSGSVPAVLYLLVVAVASSPTMAIEQERPHIKVFKNFICSGKVASYFAGIADRSIGGGDSMCYFISNSDVGKKILKTCRIGERCRIVGTVNNDQDAGDWSPIIVEIDVIGKARD